MANELEKCVAMDTTNRFEDDVEKGVNRRDLYRKNLLL